MTLKVTEQVAREKAAMMRKLGHSKERAAREAQAVRDGAAKRAAEDAQKRKR